jgi:O-antigen/teichoic acid export membrane protein
VKIIYGTRIRARLGLGAEAATRATTTMADQCVASASNFAVGVVVARLSGPAGLGAFTLAYTCWALLTTIHRSLITDLMAILGDMRREEKADFLRRGFAAEVTLGIAAGIVFAAVGAILIAVGQHSFGMGLLAVAPWIIFLDLQDYWRWIGFMQGLPQKSLQNDVLFIVVQAIAFAGAFLMGLHSVFAAVSAWGLGAAVSSLYGLWQFSVRPSFRGGWAFLRSRLPTSSWLAGERALAWSGSQLYLLLAGALLGPAALGGLKAAQTLALGPALVVINAGGSFGLPEASKQLADRGWAGLSRVAHFVTGAGVLATAACGLLAFVAGGAILGRLYGPQFAVYAPSAQIFAISNVIGAFALGPALVLTATVRMRPLVILQIVRLVVSVAAVFLLSHLYGVNGAALTSLLTTVVGLVLVFFFQSSARRSVESAAQPGFSPSLISPDGQQPVVQGET